MAISPVSFVATPSPTSVVGSIRSSGPLGVTYQVTGPLRPLKDGDWMMSVHLFKTMDIGSDTGEYRLSDIVRHPRA